jgi:ketopantoate reductase
MQLVGARGSFHVPVKAVTPDRLGELAPLDVVVVAVKAQDTRAALEQCLPHSTPDTVFVSMQAGMNHWTFEDVVGEARTIGADPNYGSAVVRPGVIEAGFPNYILVGEMDGSFTPRLRRLQHDFTHFTPTVMTANIAGTVWSKFVYGSQIMVSSMTDQPSGEAMMPIRNRRVAGALVAEAMQVSDALGIVLEPFDFFDPWPDRVRDKDDADGLMFWIEHAWPRHEVFREFSPHRFAMTGSVWRWDIAVRKRASEATAFVETLEDAARRANVDIPLNRALRRILNEIEEGKREMSERNFDELEALIEREGWTLPS